MYTVSQTAKLLNISDYVVRQEIKRGKLRAYMFGHNLRIDPSDIERYKRAVTVPVVEKPDKHRIGRYVYKLGDRVV